MQTMQWVPNAGYVCTWMYSLSKALISTSKYKQIKRYEDLIDCPPRCAWKNTNTKYVYVLYIHTKLQDSEAELMNMCMYAFANTTYVNWTQKEEMFTRLT
jgi:hypothetical protein